MGRPTKKLKKSIEFENSSSILRKVHHFFKKIVHLKNKKEKTKGEEKGKKKLKGNENKKNRSRKNKKRKTSFH
jgi:hypothetical protein